MNGLVKRFHRKFTCESNCIKKFKLTKYTSTHKKSQNGGQSLVANKEKDIFEKKNVTLQINKKLLKNLKI